MGLDAADAPRARRAAAGAGAARGSRGGLPRRSRFRRQDQPRLLASGERVEPARAVRMLGAPRREGRGAADQGPARPGARARRGPDPLLVPLPAAGGLIVPPTALPWPIS